MRIKLMVLFSVLIACFCILIIRLMYINYDNGERYEKKVLSMQSYDSQTIPYQRGNIVDRQGTVMATSMAVYNVILDCSVMTSKEEYIEPTLDALAQCFPELDKNELLQFAKENKDDAYEILLKKLPYEDIRAFEELQNEVDEKNNKVNPNIKGVWFEKEYQRSYPFGNLASSVIGFTSSGNVGTIGLENYYNDVLNGVNGRRYGYLNADSDFEKTVVAPIDGNTIISTIDANIQSIVEEKILEFNEAYRNNHRDGAGSLNTAVIIMNPNNGEILAMAEYPTFDLSNPRDTSILDMEAVEAEVQEEIKKQESGEGESESEEAENSEESQSNEEDGEQGEASENGEGSQPNEGDDGQDEVLENSQEEESEENQVVRKLTEEEIEAIRYDKTMEALNNIWKNYCVTETFEPGSVQKAFTIACGIETGTVSTNQTYVCDGYEIVGGERVRCVNRSGHGTETVEAALMDSCNDALMQMSYSIGKENFLRYQSLFNFGLKTGIDLPGETNTSTLVFHEGNMTPIDLATNSFGQNFNCTIVQMASAFSSLINGGTYYQPHLVSKIVDSKGNTVSVIEPTVLKQTVSEETSATLRKYLHSVVSEGTASAAKVDGYSMGGKTGTAEKLPRKKENYLVSFMGFAPSDDPELLIYCIVDEPNSADQPHSYYAQNIVREILEEVFPYMNIYQDEELTGINEGLDITGTDVYFTGERDGVYLPAE
uniref:peptidoglycan D,D-transpeptidase FtsI family protein n=1 Tax=Agathobacter sp. TaxID=2021311 RepID=UPI0040577921